MCGQDELGQAGQAEDVDLELAARLGQRHILDRAVGAVAGVVDEHVDPAGLGDDPLDERRERGVVGDVDAGDLDAGLGQRGHPVHAPGGGVDAVPELPQVPGGGLADARGGPGDDGDSSISLSSIQLVG